MARAGKDEKSLGFRQCYLNLSSLRPPSPAPLSPCCGVVTDHGGGHKVPSGLGGGKPERWGGRAPSARAGGCTRGGGGGGAEDRVHHSTRPEVRLQTEGRRVVGVAATTTHNVPPGHRSVTEKLQYCQNIAAASVDNNCETSARLLSLEANQFLSNTLVCENNALAHTDGDTTCILSSVWDIFFPLLTSKDFAHLLVRLLRARLTVEA